MSAVVMIEHVTQPYKSEQAARGARDWLKKEHAREGEASQCWCEGDRIVILRSPDKPIAVSQLTTKQDLPVLLDGQYFVIVY